jgi:hypothetical protein
MQGYGIAPDSSTYQALLCCYGNHGDADGVARISAELQEYAEAQLEQHRYELTQRLTSARSRSWSPVNISSNGSSGSELMLTEEVSKVTRLCKCMLLSHSTGVYEQCRGGELQQLRARCYCVARLCAVCECTSALQA